MRLLSILLIFFIVFSSFLWAGTTGKIAGIITDASTGEPLPGVNVLVENTFLGAATDLEGYYVILNIPPGSFTLSAQMIGYNKSVMQGVRVNIDQTTQIGFELKEEALDVGETIVVIADRPVVEMDVAASRANLSFEEIESIPIVNVSNVISLQAGIEGKSFRGSGSDEMVFMVNGITLRDERDNTPYMGISYTAIEDIQIQSGGFSAEFGNFRAGLVNVVTKEGSRDKYSFSFIGRYRAAAPKHFGIAPNDPNSYWIRPFIDDEVAWTGTDNGAWDQRTIDQYQEFAGGWNAVSDVSLQDNNPDNDLTPEAAQQLWKFQHRKDLSIQDPDFSVDMSFGGPVPYLNEKLGNLRFHTSYRRSQSMYWMPLSRDAYRDFNWQLKLTSDLGTGMKLMIDGMLGRETGTNSHNNGAAGVFNSPYGIVKFLNDTYKSFLDATIFNTDYFAPTMIDYKSLGIKFTKVINPTTFYEASFHYFGTEYNTNPGRPRDNTARYKFGNNYWVDESPFGFESASTTAIGGVGMRMGAGMSDSRDSSVVNVFTTKFDIASQMDRYNYVKAGAEFVITDSKVNYARFDDFLRSGNTQTVWEKTPIRAAIYLQDKLEFEGMIAQIGLRLDYSHAGGEWFIFENDPYNKGFSGAFSAGIDTLLEKESTKHNFTLSPRLAISYPISENSKLYFNYGHFRQMPKPENLYLIRKEGTTQTVNKLANPNNPLPKTVQYELGFEQNLMDQFLIRTAGYYKDLTLQPKLVNYFNFSTTVDYNVSEPNSYEDIRGFEITVTKNRGDWVRGFVNYTYMVSTYGYYGFGKYYENPAEQREYERETTYHYQKRPIPRPYARANLNFFTPQNFGPELLGTKPLEDIRLNILANWKTGEYFTYVGGGTVPGIQYNLQWKDSWNVDLRIAKEIDFGVANLEIFVDIKNVFDFKRMNKYGFTAGKDKDDYYKSLHYPENTEGLQHINSKNIPGEDKPGDYRRPGVKFVPIIAKDNSTNLAPEDLNSNYLYYFHDTGEYYKYVNGDFVVANSSFVNQVLDDKAYIDMPNLPFFAFLNPRNIFWGLKLSFDL